mmetsp:Transcript_24444/g.70418  ORF Transcript_24444/g.70418 Transcript_24444/m.70418 type:complete len:462 (+) Transcript_24444:2450-3835(+)
MHSSSTDLFGQRIESDSESPKDGLLTGAGTTTDLSKQVANLLSQPDMAAVIDLSQSVAVKHLQSFRRDVVRRRIVAVVILTDPTDVEQRLHICHVRRPTDETPSLHKLLQMRQRVVDISKVQLHLAHLLEQVANLVAVLQLTVTIQTGVVHAVELQNGQGVLEMLEGIGVPSQITLRVAQIAVGIGHLQIVIAKLGPPHPQTLSVAIQRQFRPSTLPMDLANLLERVGRPDQVRVELANALGLPQRHAGRLVLAVLDLDQTEAVLDVADRRMVHPQRRLVHPEGLLEAAGRRLEVAVGHLHLSHLEQGGGRLDVLVDDVGRGRRAVGIGRRGGGGGGRGALVAGAAARSSGSGSGGGHQRRRGSGPVLVPGGGHHLGAPPPRAGRQLGRRRRRCRTTGHRGGGHAGSGAGGRSLAHFGPPSRRRHAGTGGADGAGQVLRSRRLVPSELGRARGQRRPVAGR